MGLVPAVVYKYTCGKCNYSYYGEIERPLKARCCEYIEITPLTFKKMKTSKGILIHDHLLRCDNNSSFDEFTIFAHENKKSLLEIKVILLIQPDQPALNKTLSSAMLHLFDTV